MEKVKEIDMIFINEKIRKNMDWIKLWHHNK